MKTVGLALGFIAVLIIGLAGGYAGSRFTAVAPRPIPTEVPVATLTGPGVLRRIQNLNNIESVSYKIETVVTANKEGTGWKLGLDKQSAIVIVSGTVIAGIDLGEIQTKDINISDDNKSVQVTLPPAKILHTNLEQTKTYDYKTGAFGLVNLDPNLIEQAQQAGRQKMQDTACASDILSQATKNGQDDIENLLSILDVKVEVTTTPPAACPSIPVS